MIGSHEQLSPGTRLRITNRCDIVAWHGHTVFVVSHYPSRHLDLLVCFERKPHTSAPFRLSTREVELIGD